MAIDLIGDEAAVRYAPGLNRVEEAVISSHFMENLASDDNLQLYEPAEFSSKQLLIDPRLIDEGLIPILLRVSRRFAAERAGSASARARNNFREYGVTRPDDIRIEHEITEALFDRQFLRGPRRTCSRYAISCQINALIQNGKTIKMVIPALPFKFSSPLKSRGEDPDLGEVNFLLSLLEVVWAVEAIYGRVRPDICGVLAQFIVVSDGSRFREFVGEPIERLERYQHGVKQWVKKLGFESHLVIVDYLETLQKHLPKTILDAKASIATSARKVYSDCMWSIFDPRKMEKTLRVAATVEPDPEENNPEGRFAALLKSLIFTVNYRALRQFVSVNSSDSEHEQNYSDLYRELTAHMLYPYDPVKGEGWRDGLTMPFRRKCEQLPLDIKESLRIAMLREAWQATIDYLAEIKSDRELAGDPILMAFPDCLRWTIHAKPGQLALLTAHALGAPIQCWAGSGVFRLTKGGKIRLCTLPILALEGQGATPVMVASMNSSEKLSGQPLFYLDRRIPLKEMREFIFTLDTNLTRLKTS